MKGIVKYSAAQGLVTILKHKKERLSEMVLEIFDQNRIQSKSLLK
jgi:hypothetical protein